MSVSNQPNEPLLRSFPASDFKLGPAPDQRAPALNLKPFIDLVEAQGLWIATDEMVLRSASEYLRGFADGRDTNGSSNRVQDIADLLKQVANMVELMHANAKES